MAKKKNICSVPGCYRELHNHKRTLCHRCAGSFYYWRNKKGGLKKNAEARQRNLKFWSSRLDWFVEETDDK